MPARNGGSQRGKPRGIRRDRDCKSCKLRNIKCDLNRPRCLPCVQAELPCGYPHRVIWAGDTRRLSTEGRVIRASFEETQPPGQSPPLTTSTRPCETDKHDLADASPQTKDRDGHRSSFMGRLAVFCHQIKSIEGRSVDTSQYQSVQTMRLVTRLHDFMQARIDQCSIASVQDGEVRESVEATQYRLAVLKDLNEALKTANPFAILGIAAFAVFEVFDGPFGDWQCHLYGAKSLLDYHCRNRQQLEALSQKVTGLMEVLARLVWFDTVGAITKGTGGLIFEDWHREVLDQSFLRDVGCPPDTFKLLVSIANAEIALDPLGNCFRAMDQLLNLDSNPGDWGQCANAYRCAAVVALLTQVEGVATSVSRHGTLVSGVERLCQAIDSTPPSSPFYVHMATPAYLAGMNATKSHHRDIVRKYWKNCKLAGVPRYPGGLAKCEEAWRKKDFQLRVSSSRLA